MRCFNFFAHKMCSAMPVYLAHPPSASSAMLFCSKSLCYTSIRHQHTHRCDTQTQLSTNTETGRKRRGAGLFHVFQPTSLHTPVITGGLGTGCLNFTSFTSFTSISPCQGWSSEMTLYPLKRLAHLPECAYLHSEVRRNNFLNYCVLSSWWYDLLRRKRKEWFSKPLFQSVLSTPIRPRYSSWDSSHKQYTWILCFSEWILPWDSHQPSVRYFSLFE